MKKWKTLIIYTMVIAILTIPLIWLTIAAILKNKIYHYANSSNHISFKCKDNKIKISGFPFYFQFTAYDTSICFALSEDCLRSDEISIKTNLLIKKLNTLIIKKTENKQTKTTDIQINLKKPAIKNIQKINKELLDVVNINLFQEKQKVFNAEIKQAEIYSGIYGWTSNAKITKDTSYIDVKFKTSFNGIKNFYLEIENCDFNANDQSVNINGIISIINDGNNIKLFINSSNIKQTIKNTINIILRIIKNKIRNFRLEIDQNLLEIYQKRIEEEAVASQHDKKSITISLDNNQIFIGTKKFTEIFRETIENNKNKTQYK